MSKVLIEAHQGTMLMRAITGEGMVTEVILPRSRLLGVASIAA